MKTYIIALALSTIAGLSTVLGGLITFFIKRDNLKILSFGLGFSAGVMIFLSLVEMYPEANSLIVKSFGENSGYLTIITFFTGILIAVITDKFIPDHVENTMLKEQMDENVSIIEKHKKDGTKCPVIDLHDTKKTPDYSKIKKASIFMVIAIAIHNFPEGLATFVSTTADIKLGLTIVLAIAIHNIPEGIAVALPVYQATGKKRKALLYSFLSGIAEPIGGVCGFLLIHYLFPSLTLGFMFALVAGIMTYISFDTLLPLSKEYDTGHYSISGVVFGMLFIGFSLILF